MKGASFSLGSGSVRDLRVIARQELRFFAPLRMTLARLVILNEVKDLWQTDPLPLLQWPTIQPDPMVSYYIYGAWEGAHDTRRRLDAPQRRGPCAAARGDDGACRHRRCPRG